MELILGAGITAWHSHAAVLSCPWSDLQFVRKCTTFFTIVKGTAKSHLLYLWCSARHTKQPEMHQDLPARERNKSMLDDRKKL